jgi:hypothetical protein
MFLLEVRSKINVDVTWSLVSGLQFLPFSKIFVVHPVGKSLPTDSNSFEDSIASQLMHHQMGFDFTWMKLEKNNKKNLSLIHLKTLRSKCKKICFEKQKWICFINQNKGVKIIHDTFRKEEKIILMNHRIFFFEKKIFFRNI